MKKFNLFYSVLFSAAILFTANSYAQEKSEKICTDSTNCKMSKMENCKMDHSKMMNQADDKTMSENDSIVRKGVINLNSIDKNNDGKVFQDMMDYNVISDKAGKCPLCGMKLKEVTLKQAKDYLINAGYEVEE